MRDGALSMQSWLLSEILEPLTLRGEAGSCCMTFHVSVNSADVDEQEWPKQGLRVTRPLGDGNWEWKLRYVVRVGI